MNDRCSNSSFQYRVGVLGIPDSVKSLGSLWRHTPWDHASLEQLKDLGFNTIQVNLAWGARPEDEPLNLEDIITLSEAEQIKYPQSVPLRCDPSPERYQQRRKIIAERSALCKEHGLRTLFHFGAPFNAHGAYGDTPPNCILDEKTLCRYELLLQQFAREFSNIDDVLVYTYDQDAWLCGEFGKCPRCSGIPLHKRLVPFLNRLAKAWHAELPDGRLWWEPWELSAGQVYACVQAVDTDAFGLALHSNIAEVMATMPGDRWLINTCAIAAKRNIPTLVEYFLGATSEELEPLLDLAHPLVVLHGLRTIAQITGVSGIKEYYGLSPDREDPNLRMAGLFFENPSITDDEALAALAEPYARAANGMVAFWQKTSEGMTFFPWETTWFIREIGRSRVDHALSAAVIRSQTACTPSWASTRKGTFMACTSPDNHPWLLEDVQLRCETAARSWYEAEQLGQSILEDIPENLRPRLNANLTDLGRLKRRAMAYANHLRETNLVTSIRSNIKNDRAWSELHDLLKADMDNFLEEKTKTPHQPAGGSIHDWQEMQEAILMLENNPEEFLAMYFLETPDNQSKGMFSMTSL